MQSTEFSRHWWVILISILGISAGVSMLPTYTAGVMMASISQEFSWGRSDISSGIFALTLGVAVSSLFIGSLLDRFGARRIVMLSFLAVIAGYLILAAYGANYPVFLASNFLIGLLGGGTTTVIFSREVIALFLQHRGLAIGLTIGGAGLSAAWGPIVIERAIGWGGVPGAYIALAAIGICALPLAALVSRHQPPPSRNSEDPDTDMRMSQSGRVGLLLHGRFLALALSALMVITAILGPVVHLVPMLTDMGLTLGDAAEVAGLVGLSVVVSRILIGLGLDWFFPPLVAGVTMVIAATGSVILLTGNVAWMSWGALCIGFALGAELDLLAFFVARYYPPVHYSFIFGIIYSIILLFGGAAPLMFAVLRDTTGSYAFGLMACPVILLAAIPLFFIVHSLRDTAGDCPV